MSLYANILKKKVVLGFISRDAVYDETCRCSKEAQFADAD